MGKGIKIDCESILKVLGWVWSVDGLYLLCTDKSVCLIRR